MLDDVSEQLCLRASLLKLFILSSARLARAGQTSFKVFGITVLDITNEVLVDLFIFPQYLPNNLWAA